MKAYRIQSTEYEANEPSIFLLANGKFYGDLTYPLVKGRCNDVTNIEYWRTATCADDDRYFTIDDVVVSDDDIKKMEQRHEKIEELKKQITEYPNYGSEDFYEKSRRIQAANRPIEHAIYELQKDVKNIIISL